ncbi:glycosyltransferase family 4 protein [Funiculus sociatus GB2-A5]|uniref:Glycosyltransferase family 4 protein n=1 Tax=Funiculus sociatus GB2-A5 TaxID=2933946 RepID=A0ABV0JU89_9CYAN|nr:MULTISPECIES: glycosyltransferase family 4 protein [unclassified Trichocoleus]MBD1904185.1 glycosyltransferase family 4 protein [Trichocoleus sp. FACHB-832]MBD2061149.1 glycosyltransferase family 4 protein [Trichocoleus sp. FACHB-6]
MRILIYSYNYHPEPIGIAPLMTELAEGLVQQGHEVRVVTAMPNYPQRRIYDEYKGKLYMTEKKKGVAVQRNYVWIRPNPGLLDRIMLDASFVLISLVHALKGLRPDVILLTVPPLPVAVPAAMLGWLHRCPVILNLQDILPEAAVHTGLLTNKRMIRIFEGLEKFAYWSATKISVISEGFVDNLVGKGVQENKIVLIPNWVDVNFIQPLPKEESPFRKAHQLNGKFVVLYSGNIGRTQPLTALIDAAARLKHIPEIAVVIVGEEKALQDLELYRQKIDATNVLLLPFQPRKELPQMLAAADIGMVMQKENVISFNMPSKIQVLLASGRPIIASVPSTGTAAKAVQQSKGGIVVPPEDSNALVAAILDLYKNPDKAEALGKQGREYAIENYAFNTALDRYEKLFGEVSLH